MIEHLDWMKKQPTDEEIEKHSDVDYVSVEHSVFLKDLRDSGVTNMFGAAPYLVEQFPELDLPQAKEILSRWMSNFRG